MPSRARRAYAVCVASVLLLAAVAAAGNLPNEKLTGAGAIGAAEFGNSVALSTDGEAVLIGGINDHSLIAALENKRVHSQALGAAWVFTRTGSGRWHQWKKLVARAERGPAGFGTSVALSADGKTALIGGPAGYGGLGGAWVFVRTASAWYQEARLLPRELSRASGYVSNAVGFGASVALSADGDTALVGGPTADGSVGAAWIFTRSGATWRQQLKLTAGGATDYGRFGYSVALSGAGTTALIGAPVDGNGSGAGWLFTRSGSAWKRDGRKLTPRDETGAAQFGDSVALASAGATALVGGALDAKGAGAAWLFRRRGPGWQQQGAKLIGRGAVGPGPVEFGSSVALSGDATTAAVGAVGDADFSGAVWLFRVSSDRRAHRDP